MSFRWQVCVRTCWSHQALPHRDRNGLRPARLSSNQGLKVAAWAPHPRQWSSLVVTCRVWCQLDPQLSLIYCGGCTPGLRWFTVLSVLQMLSCIFLPMLRLIYIPCICIAKVYADPHGVHRLLSSSTSFLCPVFSVREFFIIDDHSWCTTAAMMGITNNTDRLPDVKMNKFRS